MAKSIIPGLLQQLYDVKQARLGLEDREKKIMNQLKPLVDPLFDAIPTDPVAGNGYLLTRTDGTTRTISADKLLERGVSPEVVDYATRTTAYHRYNIKEKRG